MAESIPIDRISTEGTQTRAELNDTVIREYAEAFEQGIDLPPIDVYFDEETYWLADGFHRFRAAQQIGRDSITATVHPGGQREAIFHAVGANETHGLRRTNADRRKAVMLMLSDPEWSQWSNSEIARQCHVSEHLVRIVLRQIKPKGEEGVTEKKRARRSGTEYEIRTGGIGSAKQKLPAAKTAEVEHPVSDGATAFQEPPTQMLSSTTSKIEPSTPAATVEPEAILEDLSSETLHATLSHIASDTSATTAEQESAASPDTPPESLPTTDLEPEPVECTPDTVAVGRIPLEPQATSIPEELIAKVPLSLRWDYATSGERQEFVTAHRDELQKILKKLERRETAPS